MEVNTIFDKELKEMLSTGVFNWLPWVGQHYNQTKLLVVAESYYVPDGDSDDYIRDINWTRKHVLKHAPNNLHSKLITNTARAITNKNVTVAEQSGIWNSIAQINLVQRILPSRRSEDRPTLEDFLHGWESFLKIKAVLKPEKCLFIGVTAAASFNYIMEKNGIEHEPLEYKEKIGNTRRIHGAKIEGLEVCFIKHVSYFSWAWAQYAHHYLKGV